MKCAYDTMVMMAMEIIAQMVVSMRMCRQALL